MLTTIPPFLIDGEKISPHAVDFSSGGNEKSTLNFTVIDRNGNYDIDRFERNSKKVVNITLGPFFKFSGHITEVEVSEIVSGGFKYIISLEDTSILLDKIYIGLKGINGPGFSTVANGQFSNSIFVGKQIDPCENIPPNAVDPCAPDCEEQGGAQEKYNCVLEKQIKILEVDYSFPELQAAVSGYVKFGSFPIAINTSYRANYTGTLREVLKNWCQDFGMDFYWDDNAVYFFDIRTGRQINDTGIDEGNIVSKSLRKSIKNNYTAGRVTYFGGEGEVREYSCSRNSSKRFTLRPVTYLDLFDDDLTTSGGSPIYSFLTRNYDPHRFRIGNAARTLFECIVLNYYSNVLRDLFLIYEKEGMESAAATQAWINNPTKKQIPTLGNFKPRVVYAEAIEQTGNDSTARAINAGLEIYNTLVGRMTPNEQLDFKKRRGYFVAAKYDKDQHDYFLNFEKKLAEEFIGKYWIRGGVAGANYSYSGPDGSPTYYPNGSEVIFPFLQSLPSDIKAASNFIEDLIGEDDPTSPDRTHGKFLIMERSASWVPNQTADSISKIITELTPYAPEFLGSEDVLGRNILQKGEVWVKMFPRPAGLDLNITNNVRDDLINPSEAKNTSQQGELGGIISNYGLVSARTTAYQIKTASSKVTIFLPAQAGYHEGSYYGGYVVFANGGQFASEITKVIPKSEHILGAIPATTEKDVGLNVQFRDVTQNLVDLFTANGTSCGYNAAKIFALLQNFNSRYNSSVSIEKETRTYEVAGIPGKKFTVKDGLESFSINYGENGLSSSISFSNLPTVDKSEGVILSEFKKTNTILHNAKKYHQQS